VLFIKNENLIVYIHISKLAARGHTVVVNNVEEQQKFTRLRFRVEGPPAPLA
jgi:hypothetical protein